MSSGANSQWYIASSGGTTAGTAVWFNTSVLSSTTIANPYVQGNDRTTYSAIDVPITDELMEGFLGRYLQRRRSLLLDHRKVAVPNQLPAISSEMWEEGPINSSIRQVDGYVLEKDRSYVLPDGAVLEIDHRGNYALKDESAKVVYKANTSREFNPFINASDLLESFIRDVGKMEGVTQTEILDLPVNTFIHWLVYQAALRDGDRTDDLTKFENVIPRRFLLSNPKPRCATCGRFMRRDRVSSRCAEHSRLLQEVV